MSSLSSVEAKLPPGFRFHPRDEELICDYLMKWVTGGVHPFPLLIQVDLNHCEPWDIPETACVGGKEWYFYSQRDRKYATGLRTNRATISGYWKATGKDRAIIRKQTLVGMRKTLVFYQGRAPKGRKTDWVMHEFRLEGAHGPKLIKEDWVLCRVFFKSTTSENPDKSQETEGYDMTKASSSSSQLPPLMDPYNNPTFVQASANDDIDEYNNHHHEQVPCFSIFTTTQTAPTFSLLTHLDPPHHSKNAPNFGGGIMADHIPASGINYSSPLSLMQQQQNDDHNPCSNCDDEKVIKAVLNHLTRMEAANQYQSCSINGSPSFGEGSSDSYLSEVVWNHYS